MKRRKKPESVEKKVEKHIKQYADLDEQIKALTEKKDAIKEELIEISKKYEVKSFASDVGSISVSISPKPRETFDKKKAQSFLTIEQFKSCIKIGKAPKPSIRFTRAE